MQIALKPEEKSSLVKMTNPKGRINWFAEIAGVSRNTITRLRKETEHYAEDYIVEKIRAALKTKEVKELIKEMAAA